MQKLQVEKEFPSSSSLVIKAGCKIQPRESGAGRLVLHHLLCRRPIGEGGSALEDTSVFQVEVVAIQAALLWLILNPHKLKGTKVKLDRLTIRPTVHIF